jgi:HEAT repeat protein
MQMPQTTMRGSVTAALTLGLLVAAVGPRPLAADQPARPLPASGKSEAPPERDPAVLAALESDPKTPEQLTRTALALLDLDRPQLARRFLGQLLEQELDAETLVRLSDRFGTAAFLRLAQAEPLEPFGQQLRQKVLAAAAQFARDPQRLEGLVRQLNAAAPELRVAARVDLASAGEAAIGTMLRALADPGQAPGHRRVRAALVHMGRPAVEPLIAALQAPDERLRGQVIEVLGRLKAQRATSLLLRPYVSPDSSPALRNAAALALERIVGVLPSRREAEVLLEREARSSLAGAVPLLPDHEGMIRLWHWDVVEGVPKPRRHRSEDARLLVASQLSADLYALQRRDRDVQQLFLSTLLARAKMLGGLGRPLPRGTGSAHQIAAGAGTAAVERVLAEGMKSGGLIGAAIGAAEVLGDIGDDSLLAASSGVPPPLVQALRHGNRRLRVAAAGAIMQIDPRQPYAGSSHLTDALAFLVATRGERALLIGHPRQHVARSLAGLLSQSQWRADLATTGRMLMQRALDRPDYEMVLISDAIDDPPVWELLQELRRDPRTAGLPVGLMARPGQLDRMRRRADTDRWTEAFPHPHELTGVTVLARRLSERIGHHAIGHQERLQQAAMALAWFDRLSADPATYSFYDLLRHQAAIISALNHPELSATAARVLGRLGSPAAQRALVDVASQNELPLEVRQQAAAAFAQAVRRHRLLLTVDQIVQQYERYNESEHWDRATQRVLGAVLDTVESR